MTNGVKSLLMLNELNGFLFAGIAWHTTKHSGIIHVIHGEYFLRRVITTMYGG